AAHAEVVVGLAHAQLLEEDVVEVRVVVLPRVDDDLVAQAIQLLDDAAQADDLRARAQNGQDLHAIFSGARRARSAGRRFSPRPSFAKWSVVPPFQLWLV